ncbi:MAG TPA: hypothetical protein VFE17_06585 [Candidatus Baltobacteraceae bacterium]|jgi:hypothetical protein|nr:hypothetical protein [Candidatus Baltobacteraceae bacterium]
MAGATSKGLALAGALLIAACGNNSASGAQASADSTTKAVYNDDPAGVSSNFDDTLKTQVTRSEVGILSDQMHRLGDYRGLTFVNSDPNKNEYTYRAGFSSGTMRIVVRLDPDGKFSAYRVFPQEQ